MKNVVVVVNEHRTLRKRAVSTKQELFHERTPPSDGTRNLLMAPKSSMFKPNWTQRFDDERNAVLIDEDPYINNL